MDGADSMQALLLDGGLATELEAQGHTLPSAQWSAELLESNPAAVTAGHAAFLRGGAQIVSTASYQLHAGIDLLPEDRPRSAGGDGSSSNNNVDAHVLSEEQAKKFAALSMDAARAAVKDCGRYECRPNPDDPANLRLALSTTPDNGKNGVLIAASMGPYGACLCDGSEFTGAYRDRVTMEHLVQFHMRRAKALVDAGAQLLVFETLPCIKEAKAALAVLATLNEQREDGSSPLVAWVSFSCRDGSTLNSGETFASAVSTVTASSSFRAGHIAAIGINCTPPQHVTALLRSAAPSPSQSPSQSVGGDAGGDAGGASPVVFAVYPNRGEDWDAMARGWVETEHTLTPLLFVERAREWMALGARYLGGCCRIGPDYIHALHKAFQSPTVK